MVPPPQVFFPLLELHFCWNLSCWFLIPPAAGTERWLPSSSELLRMCAGVVCCFIWASQNIPSSSKLFSGGHILKKTQPSSSVKGMQVNTPIKTASVSNTKCSSASTFARFLGTREVWDNAQKDWFRISSSTDSPKSYGFTSFLPHSSHC